MKDFLIDLKFVVIIILILILQLPFTIFVKLFTGKWILQHFDESITERRYEDYY